MERLFRRLLSVCCMHGQPIHGLLDRFSCQSARGEGAGGAVHLRQEQEQIKNDVGVSETKQELPYVDAN